MPRFLRRRGPKLSFGRLIVLALLWFWAALALGLAALGITALFVYNDITAPGAAGPTVTVTVPEGASGRDIGLLLAKAGLIQHEGFFRIAMRIDGSGKGIQHGVYELPQGYSALQLLRRMQQGPTRRGVGDFRITVPEGLSIAQIAAQVFPDNPESFEAAARNPKFIAELGLPVQSLEGFLMPDTYFFDAPPKPEDLVERMFRQFQKVYAQLLREVPGAQAFNQLEVVTVASLIEEEAKTVEERPLVASVIYNRLDAEMPLQLDATLQFALGKYGQRMLDADKQVESPYNSYKYSGLPPGPIANPGRESLRAAMNPAKSEYLYFVSNADGRTHTFSKTLAEHNRAVARFNAEMAVQRRQQGQ